MANPQAPHVPSNVAPAPEAPDEEKSLPMQGLVGSKDKFSANEMNQFPIQPTVTDAVGVERIVGPTLDNWTPADVEPDPDEIARLERVAARAVAAREARHEAFRTSHPAGASVLKDANDAEREAQPDPTPKPETEKEAGK